MEIISASRKRTSWAATNLFSPLLPTNRARSLAVFAHVPQMRSSLHKARLYRQASRDNARGYNQVYRAMQPIHG
jgi:hypothetical protein